MVSDFAKYDPADWVQDGLLRSMPTDVRPTRPIRKQPWSTTVMATAALMFSPVLVGYRPGTSTIAVSRPQEAAPDFKKTHADDPDIVSPSYWKNVSAHLKKMSDSARSGGPAERDDVPDPDSLF